MPRGIKKVVTPAVETKPKESHAGLGEEKPGEVGGSPAAKEAQGAGAAASDPKKDPGQAGKVKAFQAKVNLHHNGKEFKQGQKIDFDPALLKSGYIEEARA